MGITLSRDTVRRLARQNLFPMPRRLGRHHIAFVASEIEAWIAELPVAGPRARATKRRVA
ncbi:MAG: AlpA family phage regulatory protein [Reyranella sp.]|nr:AlpA family phage regulatory protein [Reyranella sp.]